MVEERNENLHDADGKNEQLEAQKNQTNNEIEQTEEHKLLDVHETENLEEKSVDEVVDEIEQNMATASENHEDEPHSIPFLSYKDLDLKSLLEEAKKLIAENPVQKIKKHLAGIQENFEEKYQALLANAEENEPVAEEEIKKEFDRLIKNYKKQLKEFYTKIQEELEKNLEKRKDIIEELKKIIDSTEYNFEQRLNKFKDIKKAWRTAGPIPRNAYSDIWRTFKHHEERFYDLLDLDRDYRDKVFQQNLEEKKQIIEKAKALLEQDDIHYSFIELQNLHKKWKEETGPVSKQYREEIWQEFKEITKKIHDKRREFYKNLKEQFADNLVKKQEIIEQLKAIADDLPDAHKAWQETIKKVESLREEFYQIGFVPRKNREEIWTAFKDELKKINKQKNNYYKSLKELQKKNLELKLELIKIAEELKDSEDWETATAKYKEIQEEWKKIGHVPKKASEKIWNQFRTACNYYFDRYHQHLRKAQNIEFENFIKKKEYLQSLKDKFKEVSEDEKYSIEDIKKLQQEWNELGSVPKNKYYINVKFNKFINSLYDKLNIDKRELSFLKFKNLVDDYYQNEEFYKLDQEKRFVRQKIENIQKEIQQLENNAMFIITGDKNNPFKREVEKNIKKNKEILDFWIKKLNYLNSLDY